MVISIKEQSKKKSICDLKINKKVKSLQNLFGKSCQHQGKLWTFKQFSKFILKISVVGFKMASIPQGAFAACKIRSYKDRDMTVSRIPSSTGKPNSTKHYQNEKCKSIEDYVKVNLCRYLFRYFLYLFLCLYSDGV